MDDMGIRVSHRTQEQGEHMGLWRDPEQELENPQDPNRPFSVFLSLKDHVDAHLRSSVLLCFTLLSPSLSLQTGFFLLLST